MSGPQGPEPNQPSAPPPSDQQPGADKGAKRSPAVIGAVIGVLAAIIVVVVLILGLWKPGFFVTDKLDVNKVQAGVQQVLTDETSGYGAKNVQNVKCNNGTNPAMTKGTSFNCDVNIDGTNRQVTVTVQDDNGTYAVGQPK